MQNNYINKFQRELMGYGPSTPPTPEEIIEKLAEKKYPAFVDTLERKAYAQALRDVLPLIDGWVKLDPDNCEELVGLQLVFCNRHNVFYRGCIGYSYDHEAHALRSNGVYHNLKDFTHYREEFTIPEDYSNLQKLLE